MQRAVRERGHGTGQGGGRRGDGLAEVRVAFGTRGNRSFSRSPAVFGCHGELPYLKMPTLERHSREQQVNDPSPREKKK